MARNLLSLAKSLEKRVEKIYKESDARIKETALKTLGYLIDETPVDTSKAESNWQVSLNEKISFGDEKEAIFPGQAGSTEFASAEAAYKLGASVIKRRKPGQSIYISNVASYIGDLNAGSSPQAEAYFVERIVAIARQHLKNSRIVRI